ncbi:MAG: hypothetical protein Q4B70_15360 [Lachnospiraceae bacterium]|nr:hypothetical protein [Lachnospiraceae bacterium]
MWIKTREEFNKILKSQGLDYQVTKKLKLKTVDGEQTISEGILDVKKITFHHFELFKEVFFHCAYLQAENSVKKNTTFKWQASANPEEEFDFNFKEAIGNTDYARQLMRGQNIAIYKPEIFNKIVDAIFTVLIDLKKEESLQHVGWEHRHNPIKKEYSFYGIQDDLNITKERTLQKTIRLLAMSTGKDSFGFATVKDVLDKLNPETSYPLFLTAIYATIDPRMVKTKIPLPVNLCGKYAKRKNDHHQTPQQIANIMANFGFEPKTNITKLNCIRKTFSQISLQESAQSMISKCHLLWDMPVIVQTKNLAIPKSSRDYRRIQEEANGLNNKHGCRFYPIFITEIPMEQDGIFKIRVTGSETIATEDALDYAEKMQAFFDNFIFELPDLHERYLNPKDSYRTKNIEHLNAIKRKVYTNLVNDELFDQNMNPFAIAFADSLAILNMSVEKELESKNNAENRNNFNAVTKFTKDCIPILKQALQLPWATEKVEIDIIELFLDFVNDIVKNNLTENTPFRTKEEGTYICIEDRSLFQYFEEKYNLKDTRFAICSWLKAEGFLKTNKKGFVISRQSSGEKVTMIAIDQEKLSTITGN